ncbi:uncharacterized protein UMAG_01202 [Mycosarcoma maydis]|uniref:Uncharacterized protein n=1 Tax=Mycosarcoma maydis TaxID=5270 RepID=A0A0D1CE01_MYCMD|nr:uncharacterized protein UMAG_01202 [Ustilago maydis 521]KIS71302.1 hypothetical protein UMAG_01202 [Ustilago maydis 521]|eukprot:XP_011387140.1 hypothetical protein UMAG_01202 [Ustilago maydis 521]
MAVAGVLCSAAPNPTGATIAWRKVSAGPTTPPQGTPAWDRLASQGALVADGYDGYGSVVEQPKEAQPVIMTAEHRGTILYTNGVFSNSRNCVTFWKSTRCNGARGSFNPTCNFSYQQGCDIHI